MVSESDAQALLTAVRNLFKGGFKSANKAYLANESGSMLPPVVSQKQADRISNLIDAVAVVNDWRAQKKQQKLSDFEYGKFIWEHGTLAGNCQEQACLAGYGASRPGFNFPNVYIAYIEDPGDHVFCLVDYPNPSWSKIPEMLTNGESGWVVDPWANLCCRPASYVGRFQEKLKKWSGEGKRIFYDSKNNRFTGWTDALGKKYVSGFLTGDLVFNRCEKSAPVLADRGIMV
jgi:hypothetical protein